MQTLKSEAAQTLTPDTQTLTSDTQTLSPSLHAPNAAPPDCLRRHTKGNTCHAHPSPALPKCSFQLSWQAGATSPTPHFAPLAKTISADFTPRAPLFKPESNAAGIFFYEMKISTVIHFSTASRLGLVSQLEKHLCWFLPLQNV